MVALVAAATPDLNQSSFYRHLLTSGRSEQTADSYVANLRVFAEWCSLRGGDPEDAIKSEVEAYLSHELSRIGRNTVALRLAGLRAFYAYLNRHEVTAGLVVKREKIAPRKPMADNEMTLLMAGCRNKRDRAMLTVASECGLRVSEVVGLRKTDVDLDAGLLLVRGKGAKQRWVSLSPRALKALAPFVEASTGVLWRTLDGGALSVNRAKRNMDEIARRAGVRAHWHRLRTTFASRFLTQTHDLDSLQTLMGHSDSNTTRRYAAFGAQARALEQMRRISRPNGTEDDDEGSDHD
jgi:site-specific recombinase XerD